MPLFVALEEALLVVHDDGTTTRRLTDHSPECVAAHPDGDWILCGTFDAGLHRSTDGGESFERVGTGTLRQSVMALAHNPVDPSEVWVGTEPSRVYHSTDSGRTFEQRDGLVDLPSASTWSFPPRPDTHHVRWIEVDPVDPAHLYVSIEAGALVQTGDRGETWQERTPTSRRDNHTLATHPDAPERAWAAAGDGFAETYDGGDTWAYPQEGLDHRYCWSIAVDSDDPETQLMSAARSARYAHYPGHAASYLYRRRDGDPWERLDDRGIPTGEGVLRAVIRAGDEGGEFYAANNHGLYRTTDAGSTWRAMDVEWDEAFETQTVRGLSVVE